MNRFFVGWVVSFFLCALPSWSDEAAPPAKPAPAEEVMTNDWAALSVDQLQAELDAQDKAVVAQMGVLQKTRTELNAARQQGWTDPSLQPLKDEMAAVRKRLDAAVLALPTVKEKQEADAREAAKLQLDLQKQIALRKALARKVGSGANAAPAAAPAAPSNAQPAGEP